MSNRILDKSITVKDSDREFSLNYYISCDRMGGFITYGVGIEKHNEYGDVSQSNSINDLFTAEKKAKYALDRLYARMVMPDELESSLEDMFNEDMKILHGDNIAG